MSGRVIWITGAPGAGKSTIARGLREIFHYRNNKCILLDGDELRSVLRTSRNEPHGYDRESRLLLAQQYSQLCGILANQGFTVLIATVSLFHQIHEWNRGNLPRYVEVFISVPVHILEQRDPKGLYRDFKAGKIINLPNLDLDLEFPLSPHVTYVYEHGDTPEITISKIANAIDTYDNIK